MNKIAVVHTVTWTREEWLRLESLGAKCATVPARRLGEADAHVRRRNFDWSAIVELQIHGLTAGIIGTGHIGARSAAIAAGLGCRDLGR